MNLEARNTIIGFLKYCFATAIVSFFSWPGAVQAQDTLLVSTVERPPFSMTVDGVQTGFSIELLAAVLEDVGISHTIRRNDLFGEMLENVQNGEAQIAAANISITAERERVLDFSQPIFSSGLQLMTHGYGDNRSSILSTLFSLDLLLAIVAAFALLFGGGMLMWWFERGKQEYFDHPAGRAAFPAFWWALNLVVNGGFEERAPRSVAGRFLGVFLVVSSLFVVSVFVARITSVMTVEAIQRNVTSLSDLDGRQVGTIEGSTASRFLTSREIIHETTRDFAVLMHRFETGELDAVVFDSPLLRWYLATTPESDGVLSGRIFKRENYGFALPDGSPLVEPINRSLLRLRENGSYDEIYRSWFNTTSDNG